MAEKDLLPLEGNTNEEAANEAVQSAQEATQTPDNEATPTDAPESAEPELTSETPEPELDTPVVPAAEEAVEEAASAPSSETESDEIPTETPSSSSSETGSEDESDDANDEEKEEHEDHTADYAEKETDELLAEAKRILNEVSIEQARVPMLAIKDVLMPRWEEERAGALERFIEEGGNAIDFHYEQPSREAFYQTFNEFKKRRSAWKADLANQMSVNLDLKKALLDEIKKLAESDDLPTGQTYNEFKRINDRWKDVGHVPNDEARDLYASYRFFVDRFYDNLRLSQELRDLDYKHNKEIKEGLIAEIQAISGKDWSAAIGKDLQRLHAAWKEVGPVALEDKETLWDQFREASNILHEKRRAKQDVAKAANDARLTQKESLVAELEALATEGAGEHGNWQKMTEKAKSLREAMAKVGRTFGGPSDVLWDRFKKAEKAFFKERNTFYKGRKNAIKEALQHPACEGLDGRGLVSRGAKGALEPEVHGLCLGLLRAFGRSSIRSGSGLGLLGGVALRFAQGVVGRFGFLEVLARGFNLLHGILHDGTLWVRIGKEAHVVFQLGELLAGLLHGLARIHGLLVFLAVGFLRSARFALLVAHRVKERVARRPELVPGLVRILAGYKTRFLPFGLQAL